MSPKGYIWNLYLAYIKKKIMKGCIFILLMKYMSKKEEERIKEEEETRLLISLCPFSTATGQHPCLKERCRIWSSEDHECLLYIFLKTAIKTIGSLQKGVAGNP